MARGQRSAERRNLRRFGRSRGRGAELRGMHAWAMRRGHVGTRRDADMASCLCCGHDAFAAAQFAALRPQPWVRCRIARGAGVGDEERARTLRRGGELS
ncbi:hypothetical protein EBB07_01315 [Paenibacillaceae bacterium]|nr:hypothetical protein EBB07_01315 [Paenibacillaceae bacterium]